MQLRFQILLSGRRNGTQIIGEELQEPAQAEIEQSKDSIGDIIENAEERTEEALREVDEVDESPREMVEEDSEAASDSVVDRELIESITGTYQPVEYEGGTSINGESFETSRTVYQRNDINWNYTREDGMTNLDAARKLGKAPIGPDGQAVELHHIYQKEPGPMAEMLSSEHGERTAELHGQIENGQSFRNDTTLDKLYNNFRSNYWRWRARQIQNSLP